MDFGHRGTHACTYIPGETTIDLPLGRIYVEVSKGFEIRPVRKGVEVTPDTREIVERAQRFFNRRMDIRPVRLVEIDVIGLKALETILHGAQDMPPAEPLAVRAFPHAPANLGRQDNVLPVSPLPHPLADNRLRLAPLTSFRPGG